MLASGLWVIVRGDGIRVARVLHPLAGVADPPGGEEPCLHLAKVWVLVDQLLNQLHYKVVRGPPFQRLWRVCLLHPRGLDVFDDSGVEECLGPVVPASLEMDCRLGQLSGIVKDGRGKVDVAQRRDPRRQVVQLQPPE